MDIPDGPCAQRFLPVHQSRADPELSLDSGLPSMTAAVPLNCRWQPPVGAVQLKTLA